VERYAGKIAPLVSPRSAAGIPQQQPGFSRCRFDAVIYLISMNGEIYEYNNNRQKAPQNVGCLVFRVWSLFADLCLRAQSSFGEDGAER
jgi:hypothetical protein